METLNITPFDQTRIARILNAKKIVISEENDDYAVLIEANEGSVNIPMFFFPSSPTTFDKVLETYFDATDIRPMAALGGEETIMVTNGKCILVFERTGVIDFNREVFLSCSVLVGSENSWRINDRYDEEYRMRQDEDLRREWLSRWVHEENHISAKLYCGLFTQNLLETDFSGFVNGDARKPEISEGVKKLLHEKKIFQDDVLKLLLRHCFVRSVEPPKVPLDNYMVKWRDGDIEQVKDILRSLMEDDFILGASRPIMARILLMSHLRLRWLDDSNRSKAFIEIFQYMYSQMDLAFEFTSHHDVLKLVRRYESSNIFRFFD